MITLFRNLAAAGDGFLIVWFAMLTLLSLLLLLGFRQGVRRHWPLHRLYFLTILAAGLMYSFVLSPLSAPDEVLHYVGAYELSSKLMQTPKPLYDDEGHLRIRTEDVFIDDWPGDNDPDNATVIGMTLTRKSYEELWKRGIFSTGESGYHYTLQQPVHTTPFAYLMPALGMTLARLLHLGGYGLLFLGRFMNLLLFVLLGAAAVRRTPVGKGIFFSVSLFPMLLELVSSFSYDAYILGLSFYLTSVILEHSLSEKYIGWRDFLEIGILALLLSPCKMVYSLLFLACLAIPIRRWKHPAHWIASVMGVGVLMVLSLVLVNFSTLLQYLPGAEAVHETSWGTTGPVIETYDLMELFRMPIVLLKILRNTFQIKGTEYLLTMVGSPMGHFDQGLCTPLVLVCLFYGFLLLSALLGDRGAVRSERSTAGSGPATESGTSTAESSRKCGRGLLAVSRFWLIVTVLGLVVLILLTMLSAYTPKRTDYALGVQGRYFLPALPMLLAAVTGGSPNAGEMRLRRLLLPELACSLGLLLYFFLCVCART